MLWREETLMGIKDLRQAPELRNSCPELRSHLRAAVSDFRQAMVWFGWAAQRQVVRWSDTQVVATVASGSLTGIARIQQSDEWSNAFGA